MRLSRRLRRAGALVLGLGLGSLQAAPVSAPMEMSVPVPDGAAGQGRALDKALLGSDTANTERNTDMALDLQRADITGRSQRPAADPLAGPKASALPTAAGANAQPAQSLALPTPATANMPAAALSIGGLAGAGGGMVGPRHDSRNDSRSADPRWAGTAGAGAGPVRGLVDEHGEVRRLATVLRDFVRERRDWLLGAAALLVVVAGLVHLFHQRAGKRTGQNAIERAARRASSRRHGNRRS